MEWQGRLAPVVRAELGGGPTLVDVDQQPEPDRATVHVGRDEQRATALRDRNRLTHVNPVPPDVDVVIDQWLEPQDMPVVERDLGADHPRILT
jgi:hypothetical protein